MYSITPRHDYDQSKYWCVSPQSLLSQVLLCREQLGSCPNFWGQNHHGEREESRNRFLHAAEEVARSPLPSRSNAGDKEVPVSVSGPRLHYLSGSEVSTGSSKTPATNREFLCGQRGQEPGEESRAVWSCSSQTYFCVQLQCSEDNKYCSTVTITIWTKVHRRDCR